MPARTTTEELQQMWQQLLRARLGLVSHQETRSLPMYVLTVSKAGLKMKPAVTTVPPEPPYAVSFTGSSQTIRGRLSSGLLAGTLSPNLDYPVLDQTGLTGDYQIALTYSRAMMRAQHDANDSPDGAVPENSLPSALEEQLGLHLEAKRVPMPVIVVDRVNKTPTAN